MANPPAGFVVDNSGLPEGFVVDDPQGETPESPTGALSAVTDFSKGTRLGLKNARAGGEQLYETIVTGARKGLGLADEPEIAESEQRGQELKSEIALRDLKINQLGLPGQAGGIGGEALPSMLLPGGPAGGLARKIAGGIAADTAASIADPVREDETRQGNLGKAAAGGAADRDWETT